MFDDAPPEHRKLNVGCGFDRREGYINVDLQAFHKPDVVANALDLHMVPSNWAEELMAFDVIEHFKRTQTSEALLEWNRILRPGGRLRLSTTYLTGLLRRMNMDWFGSLESHKGLILNLFSSQVYEGDFHLTAFSEKLMRYYLWSCGYEIEAIGIKDQWLFDITARKVIDYSYSDVMDQTTEDRTLITELYRQVLGREPDEEGLQSKLGWLQSGAQTRLSTLRGFLCSDEREAKMMAAAPDFDLQFDPA